MTHDPGKVGNSFGGARCDCRHNAHQPKFVVITGGPGSGKTAVLELARKALCPHVLILPESAGILFGGGFWRRETDSARAAAQRAIFHIQKELERIVEDEKQAAIGLCDRGSIDGLAYWPKDEASYWDELKTDREAEYARYEAVIHLRTPPAAQGYNNHTNPIRIESALQAMEIDQKLLRVWERHPRRIVIDSCDNFLEKAQKTIVEIRKLIPACCLKV